MADAVFPKKDAALHWLVSTFGAKSGEVLAGVRGVVQVNEGVMLCLSVLCCERETTFAPGDPALSNMREGQRSVLLRIRDLAEISDSELEAALKERGYG